MVNWNVLTETRSPEESANKWSSSNDLESISGSCSWTMNKRLSFGDLQVRMKKIYKAMLVWLSHNANIRGGMIHDRYMTNDWGFFSALSHIPYVFVVRIKYINDIVNITC